MYLLILHTLISQLKIIIQKIKYETIITESEILSLVKI